MNFLAGKSQVSFQLVNFGIRAYSKRNEEGVDDGGMYGGGVGIGTFGVKYEDTFSVGEAAVGELRAELYMPKFA